ncbi:hypothetical protein D5086_004926 [Populus alba]|uniref:Uncharacterized protein n=1 Tax=Populus alba TaxID=43335 RepID=A0ACC4CT63_POPAL
MAILSPYLTFKAKKFNLYKITITIILCTVFYLVGFYKDSRGTISANATSSSSSTAFRCAPTNHSTTTLDFAARHFAQDPKPPVAREHHFPPCEPKFSEYTPCEDVERSVRFDRDRLIYRERHCPESHEILKCRVPPPYGYKVPFSWPESRGLAWYTKMETCLTPLPEVAGIRDIAGGQLAKWPERLNAIPPRISSGSLEGLTANSFVENSELWKKRVAYYKKIDYQLAKTGRYRNLLDMNAHLGGFAAALVDDPVWVMNVVPVQAKMNTLGVIFQRGLIGTYQNWCEAMSTYPRTYDFIHVDSLFSLYENRCGVEDILLEMDRILRPEGSVIIRDDVDILLNVKAIMDAMQWDGRITDHESGPHEREKILFATKMYWTAPRPDQD